MAILSPKDVRFKLGDPDFSVFFFLMKFLYFLTKKLGNFDFSCVNLTNFVKLKNNRQNFDMKKKKKKKA